MTPHVTIESRLGLKKVSDRGSYDWEDPEGCCWDDGAQYITVGILELCGCYEPKLADLLFLALENPKPDEPIQQPLAHELCLHYLGNRGLLEHRTDVRYSWRTPKGDVLLECWRELRAKEEQSTPTPEG